ncbi:hypothetical protein Tco_1037081 [Tanacetum coccineum]
MHIWNDPSFFLTNKTGAPQGEELGLIKPLSDSSFSCSVPRVPRKAPMDKVPVLQAQHQVPNQFETPLVESEEDPASPQEILQESLKLLVRPQVASSPTCFISPGNVDNLLGTRNDRLARVPLKILDARLLCYLQHSLVVVMMKVVSAAKLGIACLSDGDFGRMALIRHRTAW